MLSLLSLPMKVNKWKCFTFTPMGIESGEKQLCPETSIPITCLYMHIVFKTKDQLHCPVVSVATWLWNVPQQPLLLLNVGILKQDFLLSLFLTCISYSASICVLCSRLRFWRRVCGNHELESGHEMWELEKYNPQKRFCYFYYHKPST